MKSTPTPPTTKSAKACTKWQIATLLLGVSTIAASVLAACFWKEFNNAHTQLNSQKDIAAVKCPTPKTPASNNSTNPASPTTNSCPAQPAGLTDMDIRGLNQAYADYSKQTFKSVPDFKLTILPQLSSAEQYIKLNKKQTHLIAMLDVIFEQGGAKAVFYRPVSDGKWICAVSGHQFPDNNPLSDEAKKVFADDKFWVN